MAWVGPSPRVGLQREAIRPGGHLEAQLHVPHTRSHLIGPPLTARAQLQALVEIERRSLLKLIVVILISSPREDRPIVRARLLDVGRDIADREADPRARARVGVRA